MGKSTAARAFASLGAACWDADQAVHELMKPGGIAVAAVAESFPGVVSRTNGEAMIDRQALGSAVFNNTDALARLEGILHPLLRVRERSFLQAAQFRRLKMVVLDIPLLFETGGQTRCDATAVVSAPGFIQAQRVMARPGMTAEKFAGILGRQMSDAEKRRRADFVIHTGLDRASSLRAITAVVEVLNHQAGACWPRAWPLHQAIHSTADELPHA
jgi:dephospho-CoA kinase